MELLFFIIGFLLGSLGGITTMCLVQINHMKKEDGNVQPKYLDQSAPQPQGGRGAEQACEEKQTFP